MGTIILRSVRKSNGEIGSNPTGTSDLTSTVGGKQQNVYLLNITGEGEWGSFLLGKRPINLKDCFNGQT